MDHLEHLDTPEIDPNFAPQARARSNTWPLRPKELVTTSDEQEARVSTTDDSDAVKDLLTVGLSKKQGSSRRNAWGNLSYADLITKAIQASPEHRLTLSQIYDWMIHNVAYFKDKGESNSSAGWKNSIRHNLSLHSRFMRIQNEGAGKSSWWVINPDAKPGKSPRRRATSMDTKAYEKKRGRVKKKVEAYRAQLESSANQSPLHGSTDELSLPDAFQLSPQDFRARTSSNASSVGRLSPIQSALEPDLHDNQVPPMSPIPWNQTHGLTNTPYTPKTDIYSTETQLLADSLAEMLVTDNIHTLGSLFSEQTMASSTMSTPSPLQPQLSPASSNGMYTDHNGSIISAPPPYKDHMPQQQHSPQQVMSTNITPNMAAAMQNLNQGIPVSLNSNGLNMNSSTINNTGFLASLSDVQMDVSPGGIYQQDPIMNQDPMMSAVTQKANSSMNTLLLNSNSAFHATNGGGSNGTRPYYNQEHPMFVRQLAAAAQQQSILGINNSLLRQALTQKANMVAMGNNPNPNQATLHQLQPAQGFTAHSQLPQLPTDLDNLADMRATNDFECDVDQIINHEMSFDDGCLDFNFDAGAAAVAAAAAATAAAAASSGGSADGQFGPIQT